MEKESAEIKNLSPNQKAMQRLLKNKPAVLGMIIIVLATMVAILGYLISPDSTPNVDDQLAEVQLKPPGFNVKMLALRMNKTFAKTNHGKARPKTAKKAVVVGAMCGEI